MIQTALKSPDPHWRQTGTRQDRTVRLRLCDPCRRWQCTHTRTTRTRTISRSRSRRSSSSRPDSMTTGPKRSADETAHLELDSQGRLRATRTPIPPPKRANRDRRGQEDTISKRRRVCRTRLLRQTISPTGDGEPGGEFLTSAPSLLYTVLEVTGSLALQRCRRSLVHLLHVMGYVHAF